MARPHIHGSGSKILPLEDQQIFGDKRKSTTLIYRITETHSEERMGMCSVEKKLGKDVLQCQNRGTRTHVRMLFRAWGFSYLTEVC